MPEPSCDDSLLVLGLVSRHLSTYPFSRLTAPGTGICLRCALPNQFRCQTSIFLAFAKKPALRRWKPAGTVLGDRTACCLIDVAMKCGSDQETVNETGGAERDRTADLMLAKHALSQLSYSPIMWVPAAEVVGLGRVELPTSPLSGVRSNQLSYRPKLVTQAGRSPAGSVHFQPEARRLSQSSFSSKGFRGQRLNMLGSYAPHDHYANGDQAKKTCIRIPACTVRDGTCGLDGHSHPPLA